MEKQGEVAILQTGADAASDHGRLYGAGRKRRHHWRAGAALGALLASQLNNLMPVIGAFLDGAALPVAIEPLQVVVIAGGNGHRAVVYALSFLARCRHSTR
jgi:lipoprotein-releasing system permease protein